MPGRCLNASSWTRFAQRFTATRGRTERPADMGERKFIVTLTGDFNDDSGAPKFRDIGLSVLAGHPHIEQRVFKQHRNPIEAEQIGDAQGVVVLTPAVAAQSVAKPESL